MLRTPVTIPLYVSCACQDGVDMGTYIDRYSDGLWCSTCGRLLEGFNSEVTELVTANEAADLDAIAELFADLDALPTFEPRRVTIANTPGWTFNGHGCACPGCRHQRTWDQGRTRKQGR